MAWEIIFFYRKIIEIFKTLLSLFGPTGGYFTEKEKRKNLLSHLRQIFNFFLSKDFIKTEFYFKAKGDIYSETQTFFKKVRLF